MLQLKPLCLQHYNIIVYLAFLNGWECSLFSCSVFVLLCLMSVCGGGLNCQLAYFQGLLYFTMLDKTFYLCFLSCSKMENSFSSMEKTWWPTILLLMSTNSFVLFIIDDTWVSLYCYEWAMWAGKHQTSLATLDLIPRQTWGELCLSVWTDLSILAKIKHCTYFLENK